MTSFKRGDVVLVDLVYVAKVRPCVVISIPKADSIVPTELSDV